MKKYSIFGKIIRNNIIFYFHNDNESHCVDQNCFLFQVSVNEALTRISRVIKSSKLLV